MQGIMLTVSRVNFITETMTTLLSGMQFLEMRKRNTVWICKLLNHNLIKWVAFRHWNLLLGTSTRMLWYHSIIKEDCTIWSYMRKLNVTLIDHGKRNQGHAANSQKIAMTVLVSLNMHSKVLKHLRILLKYWKQITTQKSAFKSRDHCFITSKTMKLQNSRMILLKRKKES